MKHITKKISAGFVLVMLLLVVGGFCGVQAVSAENVGMNMIGMRAVETQNFASLHVGVDCGDTVNNFQSGIQKTSPIGNTVAPCCVQRHDNSGTTLPTVSDERVKFVPVIVVEQIASSLRIIQQKTYLSSPSPPPKADILSSVVKME